MEKKTQRIIEVLKESVAVKEAYLSDPANVELLLQVVDHAISVFRKGGKILFCGNGGSAADAQHIAAELSGRFYANRPPLFAEALHVNSSFLTAVSNDYGYEEAFARLVEAMGREGDLLFALSTSGNSPNILRAAERARALGMTVTGMTGRGGGQLKGLCDFCLEVPSNDTPRIQEVHITIGHILCELVEKEMFG
ncbi:MAG: D-sedoheptulose 7-phosphate isomerase [Lewinellaceae bacterium]|nr:D-sedoheptulose 7-phosphate isomerase [Lewinellaceae bacterium]